MQAVFLLSAVEMRAMRLQLIQQLNWMRAVERSLVFDEELLQHHAHAATSARGLGDSGRHRGRDLAAARAGGSGASRSSFAAAEETPTKNASPRRRRHSDASSCSFTTKSRADAAAAEILHVHDPTACLEDERVLHLALDALSDPTSHAGGDAAHLPAVPAALVHGAGGERVIYAAALADMRDIEGEASASSS